MKITQLLSSLAKELEKKEIPYLIIGGQAVLLYGIPRLTRDIDITLGVEPAFLPKIKDICKTLSLKILPENPDEFVSQTWVLPVLEPESGIRVDFIFSFSHYEKIAINRGRKLKVEGALVNFASPEDLIIHKIISGRPRDMEDVKGVMLKVKKIDFPYIEKWLKEFESVAGRKLIEEFHRIRNGN
ncbi:MAG TPA: hypothetical protein ENG13_04335 [bacterium]|nr:hypothetical protein [bacterium]HEX68274.1 hypothetical protein [bacterium]